MTLNYHFSFRRASYTNFLPSTKTEALPSVNLLQFAYNRPLSSSIP